MQYVKDVPPFSIIPFPNGAIEVTEAEYQLLTVIGALIDRASALPRGGGVAYVSVNAGEDPEELLDSFDQQLRIFGP